MLDRLAEFDAAPKGAYHFGRAMGRYDALWEPAKRLSIKWIKDLTLSCKLCQTKLYTSSTVTTHYRHC